MVSEKLEQSLEIYQELLTKEEKLYGKFQMESAETHNHLGMIY